MNIAKIVATNLCLTSTLVAAEVAISNIQEVKSFDQIPFSQFTKEDCLAFDLDDTTFCEGRNIMLNANFDPRKQFVEDIRTIAGNERVSFMYDNNNYQLVENILLDHLSDLGNRNVPTIGFTARRTGKATPDQQSSVEDSTLNILHKLNVNFQSPSFQNLEFEGMNTNNPNYKNSIADARLRDFQVPGNVMVKEGVIFCNNIDKGIVLGKIFETSEFFPKSFVFIDDKLTNLTAVSTAIEKVNERYQTNIQFRGYHYTQSLKMDSTINPDVVALQKEYLLKNEPVFLTDEDALALLEQNQ